MLYYIFKIILSSVIILLISEVSKRSSLLGSILASIPLVSVLAFIWLYEETKDTQKIIQLSYNIFWLVIPSLSLFLLLPLLLLKQVNFYLALVISLAVMVALYFALIYILKYFGINIS